jgi:hypothetical protein
MRRINVKRHGRITERVGLYAISVIASRRPQHRNQLKARVVAAGSIIWLLAFRPLKRVLKVN